MIPTKRPKPWFGPDDYCEGDNVAYETQRRKLLIAAWDDEKAQRLRSMNWMQRIIYTLFNDADTMP